MPLQRFIPSSSDRYISNDKNQGAVKFGHLNAVVDYINENGGGAPAGAIGEVQFNGGAVLAADPGLFWDNTNKRFFASSAVVNQGPLSVGGSVNSTGYNQKIRVIGQGDASIGIYRNQASSSSPKIEFMKSRGTYDTPAVVNLNDIIGSVGFFGFNGSSYNSSAAITSTAKSISTAVEGDLRFTLWNNTGGNLNMMRIAKEGIGIGNALDYIPSAQLQVRGSGATSATTSLLVQNSSGTAALTVKDDLSTTFGGNITTNTGSYLFTGSVFLINNRIYNFSTLLGVLSINNNNIAYNDSGFSSAAVSACFNLDSTTRGFLPPRMTTTQKNAISTPAAGLVVYDNTLNQLSYFNGTSWVNV